MTVGQIFHVPSGFLVEARNIETGLVALCEEGTWKLEAQEIIYKWYERRLPDAGWHPCEDPRVWARSGGVDAIDILARAHDALC